MDNLNKKPKTIDDDASIYQKRQLKSEKAKLANMTLKEKISYFMTYYAAKTVLGLLIIVGVFLLFYSILKPKVKSVLYVAVINNSIDDETATYLEEKAGDLLNIDEMEEVFIDNTFYIQNNEAGVETSNTAINQVKITTFIAAKEIDLIIAPEGVFSQYIKSDFFINLEEQLPNDLFVSLSDELYFGRVEANSEEESVSYETKPYGIVLDSLPYYQNTDFPDGERRILGIVSNSLNKDNSTSFIRYLFEE